MNAEMEVLDVLLNDLYRNIANFNAIHIQYNVGSLLSLALDGYFLSNSKFIVLGELPIDEMDSFKIIANVCFNLHPVTKVTIYLFVILV